MKEDEGGINSMINHYNVMSAGKNYSVICTSRRIKSLDSWEISVALFIFLNFAVMLMLERKSHRVMIIMIVEKCKQDGRH